MGRTSTQPLPPPQALGILRRPLERFVQIFAVQDVVPGELLLGLRERSVGHQHFAVLHPNGGCGRRRLQRVGAAENATPRGLIHDRPVCRRDFLHSLDGCGVGFVGIDQHHVTHSHPPPLNCGALPAGAQAVNSGEVERPIVVNHPHGERLYENVMIGRTSIEP